MTTEQRLHPSPPAGPAQEPDKPKIDLSPTQVLGGALAAMTAAYLGSRLSVAGTVVGAAVASVVAAVASSIYTASLRTTQERVKTVFQGRVGGTSVPTTVEVAPGWDTTGTHAPAQPSAPGTAAASHRSRLSWRTVTLSALAAFLLAAVALTGLEVATGKSLSGEQGTTVTQVTEPHRPASPTDPTPSATPSSASPSSSPTPRETPSAESTPSVDSTPAPAPLPSATEPSASTPTPTQAATAASPAPSAGG
jgi:hypothetical protein